MDGPAIREPLIALSAIFGDERPNSDEQDELFDFVVAWSDRVGTRIREDKILAQATRIEELLATAATIREARAL